MQVFFLACSAAFCRYRATCVENCYGVVLQTPIKSDSASGLVWTMQTSRCAIIWLHTCSCGAGCACRELTCRAAAVHIRYLLHACHAGPGQGAGTQQAAAPQGSSREDMQQEASSSDNDASQPDMDLQKALKIVSKHYVSRNITWITCSLMFPEHLI